MRICTRKWILNSRPEVCSNVRASQVRGFIPTCTCHMNARSEVVSCLLYYTKKLRGRSFCGLEPLLPSWKLVGLEGTMLQGTEDPCLLSTLWGPEGKESWIILSSARAQRPPFHNKMGTVSLYSFLQFYLPFTAFLLLQCPHVVKWCLGILACPVLLKH